MIQKIFTLLCLMVLFCTGLSAQPAAAADKIRLSIINAENIDNLDESQLSRINSKFSDIVTASGFSGDGALASSFVVYPQILVNEMKESDGGMFRVFAVSIDVTIVVLQYATKTVFQSTTLELKGNGDSRRAAIDNAIRSMKTNSNELNTFFNNARTKIVRYFADNCSDIIKKGETQMSQKNYGEAFSTFFSIPSEVDCFNKVRPVITAAFKAYQSQKCMELLQTARASYSNRDFANALSYLSRIDPESKCYAESNKLMNECFKNVTQEEARNFQFLKEAYKTEKDLEAKRIDAARDIAVEYYRSQPKTITYNTLLVF
jgi:hypothetical protein